MFLAAKKKDSVQQSTAENSGAVNVRSTGEPRQSIWLRALGGLPLQTKLTVNEPGDIYEEEADRVAAQVMRMPDPTAANARSCACGGIADGMGECAACRARRSGLQRKSDEAGGMPAPESVQVVIRTPGEPLDAGARRFMEVRFGHDFGQVRVHTGSKAAESAKAVSAQAYTVGEHIAFAAGQFAPTSFAGQQLLAHELTHVLQQRMVASTSGAPPSIQRRLLLTPSASRGNASDVLAFLALLGPPAGLNLTWDPASHLVHATEQPGTPRAPALRERLNNIINPRQQQTAEAQIGRGQSMVIIGAFPEPRDLTGGAVQRIDVDDLLAIERGSPGSGVAMAVHELEENFRAHDPNIHRIQGVSRFLPAHQAALAAESNVSSELVRPGHARGDVTIQTRPLHRLRIFDYANYFLLVDLETVGGTGTEHNHVVVSACQASRVVVSTWTIEGFSPRRAQLSGPAAETAGAILSHAAVALAGHTIAFAIVDGFTSDSTGVPERQTLSQQRAAWVASQLRLRVREQAGLTGYDELPSRMIVTGRGVGAGDRVVITIVEPDVASVSNPCPSVPATPAPGPSSVNTT